MLVIETLAMKKNLAIEKGGHWNCGNKKLCWPKLWQWKICDDNKKWPLKMLKTKTLMTKTFVAIKSGDNWKRWRPKTLDCGDQMPFQLA
jgi:hypothetical protein